MKEETHFRIDGARLTKIRTEAELSLEDAGKLLRVNKGNLSKWERGLINPSKPAIIRLAMVFNRGDFIVEVGGGKE